jgi:hypothetical protein
MKWDVSRLRQWVTACHGEAQWRKASECYQSVFERRNFAVYHFGQAIKLINEAVVVMEQPERLAWMLGASNDGKESTFGLVRFQASAHILAVVHSMHAIWDTLAQAIFYSFRMDKAWKSKRMPYARELLDLLSGDLKTLLEDLIDGGDARYLEALSNHSKHHSIVSVNYTVDVTSDGSAGGDGLAWPPFSYKGRRYASRYVEPTLKIEFQRQEDLLFKIYGELDRMADPA